MSMLMLFWEKTVKSDGMINRNSPIQFTIIVCRFEFLQNCNLEWAYPTSVTINSHKEIQVVLLMNNTTDEILWLHRFCSPTKYIIHDKF